MEVLAISGTLTFGYECVFKIIYSFTRVHELTPWIFQSGSIEVIQSSQLIVSRHEPQHDTTNKVTVRPAKTQISHVAAHMAKFKAQFLLSCSTKLRTTTLYSTFLSLNKDVDTFNVHHWKIPI